MVPRFWDARSRQRLATALSTAYAPQKWIPGPAQGLDGSDGWQYPADLTPARTRAKFADMSSKTEVIELDEATAAALRQRAGERGVTVPDLVAEYVNEDSASVEVAPDEIAELDRRWAAIEGGQATVANEKAVRWLKTWGTCKNGS
jgi:hypothetical protein